METYFYQALLGLYDAHRSFCTRRFAALGLSTGQPKILSVLLSAEGILQKDLAARCHVEPATMTVLLQNMEKKGLVEKKTTHVSGGKRAYGIYLTEQGHKAAERVMEITMEAERICLQDVPKEEKDALLSQMMILRKKLLDASET